MPRHAKSLGGGFGTKDALEARADERMGRQTEILRLERCLKANVLTGTVGWVLISGDGGRPSVAGDRQPISHSRSGELMTREKAGGDVYPNAKKTWEFRLYSGRESPE